MMMDEETEEMIHRNSIESFKSKAMQIDSRQGNNKSSLIKKLPSNNAAVDKPTSIYIYNITAMSLLRLINSFLLFQSSLVD